MKNSFILLILCLFFVHAGFGQWTQATGISGTVNTIVAKGNFLFAGTNTGVYRSSDNGTTWQAVNNGISSTNIYTLGIAGNYIFAGTYNSGIVFRSSDEGNNWNIVFDETANPSPVKRISGFAYNGVTTCMVTIGLGAYLSNNNGTTWTRILDGVGGAGLPASGFTGITTKGTTFYLTDITDLYTSLDNGISWQYKNAFGVTGGITNIVTKNSEVFVASQFNGSNGIDYSSDDGVSWTPKNVGLGTTDAFSIISVGNNLFAGTTKGVALSTNNANNWNSVSNNLPSNAFGKILLANGDRLILGTNAAFPNNGFGIWYAPISSFIVNTGQWTQANGISNKIVYCFAEKDNIIFAGTNTGIYQSTDEGLNWTAVGTADIAEKINSIVVAGDYIIAGGRGNIFRSSDNGLTWRFITKLPSPNFGATVFDFAFNGTTIVSTHSGGYYHYSNDFGLTWNADPNIGGGLQSSQLVSRGKNFSMLSCCDIMESQTGLNWQTAPFTITTSMISGNGLLSPYFSSILVKGKEIYLSYWGGPQNIPSSAIYGVAKTNDLINWSFTDGGISPDTIMHLDYSGNQLFAAGKLSIHRSIDNATSWVSIEDNLPDLVFNKLITTKNNILVSCSRKFTGVRSSFSIFLNSSTQSQEGVWVRPLSDFSVPVQEITNNQNGSGSFHNLTIKSGGKLTLTDDITISGNLIIENGGELDLNGKTLNGKGSIEVKEGGKLIIYSDKGLQTLKREGDIQVEGKRTFAPNATYEYKGTTPQETGDGLPPTVKNIIVNNLTNVTLTNPTKVAGVLKFQNGNMISNNNLTLGSFEGGTFIVDNTNGGVTGQVIAQRYTSEYVYRTTVQGYTYFSSPVNGATIQNFADKLPIILNPNYTFFGTYVGTFPNFFRYNESKLSNADLFEKGWESPASLAENLEVGRGYICNLNTQTTIDFKGTLNNGEIKMNLSKGNGANSGWNLVGNPYPSPLDWEKVHDLPSNKDFLEDYIYRRIAIAPYAGMWAYYKAGAGGLNGAVQAVAMGQGFFAKIKDAKSAGNYELTFNNGMRIYNGNPQFFRTEESEESKTQGVVKVKLTSQKWSDETMIYFKKGASEKYDEGLEVPKSQFNSSPAPNLFTSVNGKKVAFNAQSTENLPKEIPLHFIAASNGQHEISLSELRNFKENTPIYLEDKRLNINHDLSQKAYSFTANAGTDTARFVLKFEVAFAQVIPDESLTVYPNPAGNELKINIDSKFRGKLQIRLLDILGREVKALTYDKTFTQEEFKVDMSSLNKGTYLIEIQDDRGKQVKKIVKE